MAYVIVGLISVIFGVWGIGSYFTPSSDPSVADVGSAQILNSELQQSFNQRYQQLRQSQGEDFDSKQYPAEEVRKQVLKTLIDEAILKQYAHKTGYRVVDGTLAQAIRGQEQFQDEEGNFSAQRYRQLLSQAGMSPADYEARLRPALLADQPRQVITQSSFAVPAEIKQALRYFHEQRKVNLLSFDTAAYRDKVKLSDEDIQSYYEKHKDDFMAAPRVKLAFVELDADQIDLDESDQKKDQSRDKARAEAFKDRAERMEDLAYQAPNDLKTLSDELDLKIQHTDWFGQDEEPDSGLAQYEQVRKAAFSDSVLADKLNSKVIKIGEQRRVVLRIQEHEKARHKPLEAVRNTIRKRLTAQKVAELAREDADKARQQAQKGQSLQQLASRFSAASIKQVGFIGRDEQSLSEAVLDTAFAIPLGSDDSDDGHYRVTDDGDERVVLVQVTDQRVDDKAEHAEAEQRQIAEQMSTYNANLEYSALMRYLRNTIKVKVHESNLN